MKILLLVGIALIILSVSIVAVSGFVYEMAQHTETQNAKVIAALTVQNSGLGSIEEGETKTYNQATVSSLGSTLDVTTTKDNVCLNFNSNLETLSAYYSTYNITVKYAAVGSGSTHSVGDTACRMTLASPDPDVVTLDKTGIWRFDFEITTTAKSVSADQTTTATIAVTTEST